MTPGTVSSAATEARSRRRTSTLSRLTGSATTTCTRQPCVRRAARASSPDATITATAWPPSPSWRPAFPAMTEWSPSRTASSEMLLEQGYNTFMVGKRHLTPSNQETGAGPYTRWPLARGFERFYGFLGGDTSQWYPDLVYDNHQVEPPKTSEEGDHLTEDFLDKSIQFIADAKQVDPAKPFHLHLCFGATHAPHHVPKEWADKYAGKFDDGWDAYCEKVFARQKELGIVPADTELSRHDPDVPAWDSLSDPARKLSSRMMAVNAGFLEHTDHHLGRLLDFLRAQGELDNTIVMVVSDNGASAEGGPTGTTNEAQFFNNAQEPLEESLKVIDEIGGPAHFNHYPWGWTWAGNTPFRRWKRETYRGGSTDPFIVSWPVGIKARFRSAPSTRTSSTWCPPSSTCWACSLPPRSGGSPNRPCRASASRTPSRTRPLPAGTTPSTSSCLATAPSTTTGGGRSAPARPVVHRGRCGFRPAHLRGEALRAGCRWLGALPCRRRPGREPQCRRGVSRPTDRDDRDLVRRGRQVRRHAHRGQRPGTDDRREAPGGPSSRELLLHAQHAVDPLLRRAPVLNRPHSITASVEIPDGGAEGVLFCQGSAAGGYSLFIKEGRLHYIHNYVGRALYGVSSPEALPSGTHEVRFEFEPTGPPDMPNGKGAPGRLQLYVDGGLVANAEAPVTTPFVLNPGALTCGANPGSPVTPDYTSPFKFTGTIHKVTVDVSGELRSEEHTS